jgi:hypothetical protein
MSATAGLALWQQHAATRSRSCAAHRASGPGARTGLCSRRGAAGWGSQQRSRSYPRSCGRNRLDAWLAGRHLDLTNQWARVRGEPAGRRL